MRYRAEDIVLARQFGIEIENLHAAARTEELRTNTSLASAEEQKQPLVNVNRDKELSCVFEEDVESSQMSQFNRDGLISTSLNSYAVLKTSAIWSSVDMSTPQQNRGRSQSEK